jgi:uncharacterized damage-inducible protein DinB
MAGLAHHLFTMACNNAWSNHRLLKACAALSDEEFAATRTSFFPSIKATLNHNVTVDWLYLDALERALSGKPVNRDTMRFFEPREPFATCAELQVAQREADTRLTTLCRDLQDSQLERAVPIWRSKQGVVQETVTRMLAHLFEHQIHHRGQAHAMLASTRVAPPQLDEFFCVGDADLRATDLAELGLSEAAIWGAGAEPVSS